MMPPVPAIYHGEYHSTIIGKEMEKPLVAMIYGAYVRTA